ncbi:MAG: hypothetical protein NWE96_09470 [Candidatus Bathyarchaeota archaeon]|mgnify:CR=1 FL=1|nr:hypothetical protein [Candidatus Bathyarchaeota archaeon]
MSSDINVIQMFVAGLAAFSLMFLPSLVELMYPKDAGPRVICGGSEIVNLMHLASLEENYRLDSLEQKKLSGALGFLPNLEQFI